MRQSAEVKVNELVEDKILFLSQALKFNVRIKGNHRSAEVLWAREAGSGEYHFKISFSDGHEDVYRFDAFEVFRADDNRSDAYCRGLAPAAYMALWSWDPQDVINAVIDPITGLNLWIIRHKGDQSFTCYAQNDFLFSLHEAPGKKMVNFILEQLNNNNKQE